MSGFALLPLLETLVRFLEARRVAYMVMGGLAVRYWGLPRPTYDLDFTLALDPPAVPNLCGALEAEGFAVPEIHEKGFLDLLAGMKKFSVTRWVDGKAIGIDFFLVTTAYQRQAFDRKLRKRLNGGEAWIISAEDLILHKLIAGRDRDLGDVGDVLWMNRDADRGYLRQWAAVLGVSPALERKLSESPSPDPRGGSAAAS